MICQKAAINIFSISSVTYSAAMSYDPDASRALVPSQQEKLPFVSPTQYDPNLEIQTKQWEFVLSHTSISPINSNLYSWHPDCNGKKTCCRRFILQLGLKVSFEGILDNLKRLLNEKKLLFVDVARIIIVVLHVL